MMGDNSPRAALNFRNHSTASARNQGRVLQKPPGRQRISVLLQRIFRAANGLWDAQKPRGGDCHATELQAYRVSFIRQMNGG
jgi:hypothetical protein